jgi:hypothetical protein
MRNAQPAQGLSATSFDFSSGRNGGDSLFFSRSSLSFSRGSSESSAIHNLRVS